MAGVQPTKFINYISQFKKLLVTRNNGIISQKFKIDSATNDKYYFSIVNSNCRLVSLENRTFKIYGSVFDSKDALRVLFYSDDCTINQDGTEMCFTIETYTSQYMNIVKTNKIIDITIVEVIVPAEGEQGQDITQVILRDQALAYKRPYIDSVQPTEIVYRNILTGSVPFVNAFGAGEDINLIANTPNFAFGTGLETNNTNQVVLGQYNQPDATKIIVIGNGQNTSNRSNLLTVDYDGNIVTNGALSATAVYINGQEVGTQVDQKLASTSAWVNETFETKDASTSAYNSLVEEIGDVDSKVDNLSSVMTANYATKVELGAVVDAIPTKVSELTNDAGYITSSEIPTDYVTNGQLDEAISSFITIEDVPVYTGSGAVVVDQNHVISLTGQLGKTYNADNVTLELDQEDNTFSIKSVRQKITAGSGISLSEDQQTGITTISVFGSGTSGDAVQYFEGEGISIDDYTISINQTWLNSRIPTKVSQLNNDLAFVPSSYLATYATKAEIPTVPTNVGAFTNDVGYLTAHQSLADYYTKTQTDSAIATATDDMATETYVQTASANIVAQIPNSGTIIDVATGAIPTGVASFANDAGYLTAHQDLTDYAKTSEVNSAIEAATSGKADLSALEAVDDKFDNYYTSVQVDSAIETASASIVGQIPLSTSQLVNDSGYLTAHQSLVGYATETYVDGAIDTASASIVAQIPTSASQLANDVPYLTAHQSLDNYYNKTQVDTALALKADSVDVYTKTEVNNAITSATSGKADKSELQSVSGTLNTAIGTKAASADVYSKSQVYTKTEADNKFLTEHQSLSNYYTKSQVYTKDETDTEIYAATSGAASKTWVSNQGFAKTADLPTVPTKVSDLQNDAGYLTSIPSEYVTQTELTAKGYLTAVPSEYALKTDIPTYTGASGISVDSNHVIAITGDVGKTYTGGTDIEITTGNVINFTGTIPSIEGLASETYVNNAVSSKADKSELTAYLTAVPAEYITETELSAEGFLKSVPTTYVERDELTSYAQLSDIPSVEGFATEADLQAVSAAVPTSYVVPSTLNDYATTAQINYVSSVVSTLPTENTTYTAGTGLELVGTEFSLTNASDYAMLSDLPTDLGDLTNNEGYIKGITVDIQNVETREDQTELMFDSNFDFNSEYITLNVSNIIENNNIALTSDIPTSNSGLTNDAGYQTATQVNNAITSNVTSSYITGLGIATTGQIPTNNNQLENGAGYITGYENTTYTSGTGINISGNTNIISVDQEWLEGFVANLGYITHDSDTLYHADEETINLTVVNDQNTFSVNQTWLNNFLAAKEYATTGYVTGYCSAFATNGYVDQVSANIVTGQITGLADRVSDIENAGYITGITIDVENVDTRQGQTSIMFNSYFDFDSEYITLNTTNIINDISGDIYTAISGDVESQITGKGYQTAAEVSGIASGVVENYITVSGLATENYVRGQIAQIPAAAEYTAGTGLQRVFENGKYVFNLTGTVLTGGTNIEVSGKSINFTGTIPTSASELQNDVGYISSITVKINQPVWDDNEGDYVDTDVQYPITSLVVGNDQKNFEIEDNGNYDINLKWKGIRFVGNNDQSGDEGVDFYTSQIHWAPEFSLYQSDGYSEIHISNGVIPTGLASWDSATNSGYLTGLGFITSNDLPAALSGSQTITITNNVISLANASSYVKNGDNVSRLNNDAGYLTEHQSLTAYATLSELSTASGNAILTANAYTDTVSANLQTAINNLPVPTAYTAGTGLELSGTEFRLTAHIPTDAEMSGVVSNVLTASGVALESEIPTAVSELTNDSDFISGVNLVIGDMDPINVTTLEFDHSKFALVEDTETITLHQDIATIQDIPTSLYNWDADVTSTYIREQGFALTSELSDTTYASGRMISISGDNNSINFTGEIPVVSTYVAGTGISITSSAENEYTVAFDNTSLGYQTAQNVTDAISAASGNIINGLATTDWVTNTVSSSLNNAIDAKADSSTVTGIDNRVSANETAIESLASTKIDATSANTIANNAITSTVTSSYLTGLGMATTGQIPTNSDISGIASAVTTGYLTGYYTMDEANAAFLTATTTIPTKTSDLTNDSGYITSITSSDITTALGFTPVSSDTTYTAGTGLKLTGTEFSLSAAGANEDKVLSSHNGTISWQTNVAGTDIDTVCGMLSSANNNLTISKADNKILFTATGGGSAGNIVGGVGIRVIQDGGNTVISIATASLVAAPSSYTFDFRENGGTTSYDFDYTSYSGNQNLIMSYQGTLPSGVTATQIASGYQFTATSAANVGNNNSTITAYFDAYDITQPASAEVQLTTIGYVSATIAASDTSMTFNNDVASTISALTWTYNGSDTVSASYDSTQIPFGIQVEQNGNSLVFTGTGGSYSANATISLSVTLIANDIIPVTVTVTLVVEGVTLPLSATPLTFKNIAEDSSTATIKLYKFGNSTSSSPKVPATYQYSKNDGAWTSYTLGTQIQLTSGQTVAFSGSYFNNGLNDGLKFNTSGSNVLQVYGNIASLDNFRTENYNDVTTHGDAIPKGQYAVLFGGADPWNGSDQVGTPCKQLIDASRLYINYLSAGKAMFRQLFAGCSNLSGTIPSFASFTAGGEGSFLGAFAYTKVSGTLDLSNYQGTIDSYEFNNIVRATNITDAIIGGSGFVYNSSMGIGSGWNISNMFYDCSSLTSVQVDFTAWPSNDAAQTWMEGVAAAGTFTCPAALDTTTRDSSHVPAGWTVITK